MHVDTTSTVKLTAPAAEGWMPHHPVVNDLRIRNFSIEPRLKTPCRVRLLERLGLLPIRRLLRNPGWSGFQRRLGLDCWRRRALRPRSSTSSNHAVDEALESAEVRVSLAKLGMEAKIGTAQDFAVALAEQAREWKNVIDATGIKSSEFSGAPLRSLHSSSLHSSNAELCRYRAAQAADFLAKVPPWTGPHTRAQTRLRQRPCSRRSSQDCFIPGSDAAKWSAFRGHRCGSSAREDGPALACPTGECRYFWNGVHVPDFVIERPHHITPL